MRRWLATSGGSKLPSHEARLALHEAARGAVAKSTLHEAARLPDESVRWLPAELKHDDFVTTCSTCVHACVLYAGICAAFHYFRAGLTFWLGRCVAADVLQNAVCVWQSAMCGAFCEKPVLGVLLHIIHAPTVTLVLGMPYMRINWMKCMAICLHAAICGV